MPTCEYDATMAVKEARFYDPDLGRMLSADPMRQNYSPYIYGNNNPVNYVDPDGNLSISTTLTPGLYGLTFDTNWMLQLKRYKEFDLATSIILPTTGKVGWMLTAFSSATEMTTGTASLNYGLLGDYPGVTNFFARGDFEESVQAKFFDMLPSREQYSGAGITHIHKKEIPLLNAAMLGTLIDYQQKGYLSEGDVKTLFEDMNIPGIFGTADENYDPVISAINVLLDYSIGRSFEIYGEVLGGIYGDVATDLIKEAN